MPGHEPPNQQRLEKRRMSFFIVLIMLMLSSCQPGMLPAATKMVPTVTPRATAEIQPVSGGPVLLRAGISVRSLANVDAGSIRLALHPQTGDLYILNPTTGLRRMKMDESHTVEKVANPQDIVED